MSKQGDADEVKKHLVPFLLAGLEPQMELFFQAKDTTDFSTMLAALDMSMISLGIRLAQLHPELADLVLRGSNAGASFSMPEGYAEQTIDLMVEHLVTAFAER